MSDQALMTLSIATLAGAAISLVFVLHLISIMGRHYTEFVEKHITKVRGDLRKLSRETGKAMDEVVAKGERGSAACRELQGRVVKLDADLIRLQMIVEAKEARKAAAHQHHSADSA